MTDNGYIDGSIHVPLRDLFKSMDKLKEKDTPIVVYCASGHRGGIALMALQFSGDTNVKSLSGGLNAWVKGNFPVVKK